jgi:hypothetical protein
LGTRLAADRLPYPRYYEDIKGTIWLVIVPGESVARSFPEETTEIRRSTHTGRPPGTPDFARSLEKALKRRPVPDAADGAKGKSGSAAGGFWVRCPHC